MGSEEPSSPQIFAPSSLSIDDSKLCFNKNHFSRPDFDVQRFMNLARRRAGLEQIQKDLRLYLKSLQHSMIELINVDYADFVHLSSNLVALQSSIDKIDKDIQTFWAEFENSTTDSVGTAEQIELRCDQLSYNRRRQTELRDKIAFLAALHRLQQLLSKTSSSILWLEKVASCVVDLTSYFDVEKLEEDSRERQIHARSLTELERFLCNEGVHSVSGDCSTLPIVLSILSLTNSSHVLTAAIVADYLHPRLVHTKENQHELLKSVLKGVIEIRETWIKVLGMRYSDNLKVFLDQTLLTFVLTFLEKCLGMVIVPTDTKLFHKCFTTIDEFVRNWPSRPQTRALLKAVRDKFNFLVYFKLTTFKLSRQVDSLSQSEVVDFSEGEQRMKCPVSTAVLTAIETVWSDDVFLFPLIDKFWDFTLKMLAQHLSWAQHMIQVLKSDKSESEGVFKWKNILCIRSDLKSLHSSVFDLSLEQIWTKLRDLDVETSMFGQSLTRHGQRVDIQCSEYDELFLKIALTTVEQELEAASDIPKCYRWTRKPAPTTLSPYVEAALDKLRSLGNELEFLDMESEEICSQITKQAFSYLLSKLTEVFQATQMHTSSRILVSRKTNVSANEGLSDNDKIKIQIFHDLDACINFIQEKGLEIEGMLELRETCRVEEQLLTASPISPSNSSNSLVGQEEVGEDSSQDEIYRVLSQSSLVREGSA